MNLAEYRRMFEVEDIHWWYVGLHDLVLCRVKMESQLIGRPLQILDAGCGTGRLLQRLSEYGDAEGYDASEEAVRYCHMRGVKAEVADLNELHLKADSYDVITSIDVLYHAGIKDDVDVLKRFYTGLKPGGVLIINLVAFELLRSSHDIAVHTRERYSRQTLLPRIHAAGFLVDFATYRVCLLFPIIAVYRLLHKGIGTATADTGSIDSDVTMPHPLINVFMVAVIKFENWLLKRWPLPVGSSIFVCARKPIHSIRHAGSIQDPDCH